MADRSNDNNNNFSSWIFPLLMLFFFPPVGVLMLVLKVFNSPSRGKSPSRHPYYTQQDGSSPVGARTTAGVTQQSQADRERQEAAFAKIQQGKLNKLESRGKRLAIVGGILLIFFLMASAGSLEDAFYWLFHGEITWFLDDLVESILPMCFTAGSGGLLFVGLRQRKQAKRFRRYLAMIGKQSSIPVATLAEATGKSEAQICSDLDDMLNDGLFPQGYLDHITKRLVINGSGVHAKPQPKKEPEEKKAEAPKDEDLGASLLREIRAVNDDIEDKKLSAQIDRIGVITAKILEYQKSRPEKAPQLHSFLSYYLPTTLKILRAYAQLEDQEVAGDNITAAMERIEGMMDKVVEGFEKQLDMLFQGDVMDIASDVDVLERMLAKDGLSDNPFNMTMPM